MSTNISTPFIPLKQFGLTSATFAKKSQENHFDDKASCAVQRNSHARKETYTFSLGKKTGWRS